MFTRLFPNMKFNTPVPTTVIVFKSDSSYASIQATTQTPRVIFNPDRRQLHHADHGSTRRSRIRSTVIFHEYTHLLVNNTFESAPVWFNEGLAEYYSTFSITDDQKVGSGTRSVITFTCCAKARCCRCELCLKSITNRHTTTRKTSRASSTRNRGR